MFLLLRRPAASSAPGEGRLPLMWVVNSSIRLGQVVVRYHLLRFSSLSGSLDLIRSVFGLCGLLVRISLNRWCLHSVSLGVLLFSRWSRVQYPVAPSVFDGLVLSGEELSGGLVCVWMGSPSVFLVLLSLMLASGFVLAFSERAFKVT
ncbi:hypothetical protein F2Q70_00040488 [Brassica cretica]|uniref:Uncharacterized protein n=1 Tax=Brassica cretica TaxID=69181 RepID=A0A8S9K156_BRACR|nr:hypothetical protein F2Q70_00040488 [Brassica cretica]